MNNLFKKLAFMMAVTMTVATAAPAAQASAAATPVLNTTSKKLYMETDVATGKYSNTFTLKVWNLGDYRVTFESSNPEVATVNKWWGTVKTVAPGEATITATISNKTTGKVVKTLTSKVWVKRNATDIGFSTASAAKFDEALKVGDKAKLNVFRTDADGNVSWKQADKTKVTDYIQWTSSDTSVATVDKWGTVTAVAPGEATITATSLQTEDKTVPTTEVETIKVTVKAEGITEVKQTTAKKIQLTVGSDLSEAITAETLVVAPTTASVQTPIVKSVKWNDEKTVATVEFYTELTDKEAYAISVTGNDDLKAEFVASVGEVAAITITNPSTVLVNNPTTIKYTLTDANGVEVSAAKNSDVSFKVIENDLNGYTDKDAKTVTVFEKGKTVVIQATYHTNTYTTEGEEIVIKSNAFVVTGVDKTEATLSDVKYTISNKKIADTTTAWDSITQNLRVTMNDDSQKLQVYVKDSLDNKYFNDNVTFESMDTSKLLVSVDGTLYPVAEGTAYVKVTVGDTEKTFLVKVTVAAESKVSSLVLDQYTATVAYSEKFSDKATFTVTAKDQYGATKDQSSKDLLGGITAVNDAAKGYVKNFDSPAKNKVVFDPQGVPAGSYSFKLTVGDCSRVITIIVKEATGTLTNRLVVSTSSFDIALNNGNIGDAKNITLNLYSVGSNGIKADELTSTHTFEVTRPDGTKRNVDGNVFAIYTETNGELKVSENIINEKTDKVMTGTYTVAAYDAKGKLQAKATFVITNTTVTPTVKLANTTAELAKIEKLDDLFTVATTNKSDETSVVEFKYKEIKKDGQVVTGAAVSGAALTISKDSTVIITEVTVKESYNDSKLFFNHVVKTNLSVKFK